MASPQLDKIIRVLRERQASPPASLEQRRAAMEALSKTAPLPAGTQTAPADAEGVPAEWVSTPGAEDKRAVLYLHGGGYTNGSVNTHRNLAARISARSGARCLVIDYRLAPEHPFPAAIEDATTAYRWMLAGGLEPACLAIAGDSAGGGLTLAALVALRDARQPLPAAAVCLSPWVDMEGLGESMTSRADADPMVDRDGLLEMARMYLAGVDPKTPLAAPLHAELEGLCPLLVQVGTAEVLYDDAVRIAERARKARVDVMLQPWDEMIHVFQAFAPALPEADEAIAQIGEFLRKRLA